MGNNNFMKIFAIFAWLVFAAVSCWATAESLFLSDFLSGIPFQKVAIWALVIGFYVLTSLGTKWIVDGISENYSENKLGKLIGGIVVIVLFWVAISMPTNAHTFLYKRSAKPVAQKEIDYLDGQLQVIIDEDATLSKIQADLDAKIIRIKQLEESLVQEIRTTGRIGVGDKAEGYLLEIERELGISGDQGIPRKYNRNTSAAEINDCIKHYQRNIERQLEIYKENKAAELVRISSEHEKKVAGAVNTKNELSAIRMALDDSEVSREQVLSSARNIINSAYGQLDNYNLVSETETTREQYIRTKKGMPSSKLVNVAEVVYRDYFFKHELNKKYDMPELKGMIYYVLLSILIDLAAFLFFNIGFKKDEY